jgi:uncharacterized membrane protein
MWVSATVSNDVHQYYYFTIGLLILLFIATVLTVQKIAPQMSYLYVIAPSGIAALFINWDMWAIITMLLAIYFFDQQRYSVSALTLAISIATKFFPIVLLLPVAAYFIRKGAHRELLKYCGITIATYLAINLPFILTTPQGWLRFFQLNLHRNPDWGSLWLALEFSGIHIPQFNLVTLLALVTPLAFFFFLLLNTHTPLTLAESSIFFIAVVMTLGKVYSPQYVLWLAPLVVIALKRRELLPYFWGWQIVEVMYHLAIWLHLAGLNSDKALIPQSYYTGAIFIRIAGLGLLVAALARQHRLSPHFPREFLFKTAEIYP